MSDSSRVQIAYGKESSWGVIPAVAFTEARMTGEGLNFNIASIVSNEIRADRQITDLVQVDAEAAGNINVELSYGAYDDWLESALFSGTWAAAVAVSETDITAANADNSYNTTAGDFVADGVVAGMWLLAAGFSNAANNGYVQVVSVTTTKIVVAGATLVDETAGTRTFDSSGYIRNNTTVTSFTLEKFFSDKTQYLTFAGCVCGQVTINLNVQEILSGAFDWLGKDAVRDTSTAGSGAYGAAAANDVMNAVANVESLMVGGVEVAAPTYMRQFSLTLNNNLRGLKAISNLGNVQVGAGRSLMNGTMQVYFEDGTFYDLYLNNTETSVSFRVADAAGNAYVFTFPRIKFTGCEVVAGAIDQDVLADMTWQAIRESVNDFTVQIDRFAA